MQGLKDLVGRFARDTRGATSIEYGLIAMLVAVGRDRRHGRRSAAAFPAAGAIPRKKSAKP